MTAQNGGSQAFRRDRAVLLENSVLVLSSLLQKAKHVKVAAETAAEVRDIVKQFKLEVSGTVGHVYETARIPDAGASCRSALRLRHQFAPAVSIHIRDLDTALRQKQQEDLLRVQPEAGNFWEAQLENKLLKRPPGCLCNFPYLYLREWTSVAGGKGDVVFTDGQGLFAVVEIKYINLSNKRNVQRKKRKCVKEQAQTYGQAFRRQHAEAAVVIAGVYTEAQNSVQWIALEDQEIKRVSMLVQVAAAVRAEHNKHQHDDNAASLLQHATRQTTQATANFEAPIGQQSLAASARVPRSAHTTRQVTNISPNLSEEIFAAAELHSVQETLPMSAEEKVLLAAGVVLLGCCLYSFAMPARPQLQRQRQRKQDPSVLTAVACLSFVSAVILDCGCVVVLVLLFVLRILWSVLVTLVWSFCEFLHFLCGLAWSKVLCA